MLDFGALSNIKVLDLSRMAPGPYSSMILADHGAEVIAIEDKRYQAEGNFVENLYRNKRHMTLDLKTDTGKKILYKMVADADIFLEGFRPGVAKKLGIDYDTLQELNPGLVYCSITGYGQNGRYKDMAGHDINYISYAGFLDQTGIPGHPPVIPGIPVADIAGGAMNAVIGILLALVARQNTGTGQQIDISMTDGTLSLMQLTLLFREMFGQTPLRGEGFLSHRYACYHTYETKDGRFLSVGAVENRFWKILCDTLGVPEYTPLQYDETSKEKIKAHLKELFLEKPLAEWEAELAVLDTCVAPVRTLDEVFKDPVFIEREMVYEVNSGKSTFKQGIGIPVKLSRTPGSIRSTPVGFGENTEEILEQMGYTTEEIVDLKKEGVV